MPKIDGFVVIEFIRLAEPFNSVTVLLDLEALYIATPGMGSYEILLSITTSFENASEANNKKTNEINRFIMQKLDLIPVRILVFLSCPNVTQNKAKSYLKIPAFLWNLFL